MNDTDDTPDEGTTDDSALPGRVRRAARDHDAVDAGAPDDPPHPNATLAVTSTPFEAAVAVAEADDGRVAFDVTVSVPTLSAVAAEEVADVVEDGWLDTFERRIAIIGDVTAAGHDLDPAVERRGDEVTVTESLRDVNERRGLNDAVAVVDFVEGTYVQGVIPGYEYGEPVTGLIGRARAAGGDEGTGAF
ncbi:DUF5813 family protein [Halobaculum gomorrense]|uniref:Uncharacterized protein n=1 Tax=Halobaculum gomorrense TaxID=43928 RepID=A0A1M5MIV6_9EURY|nr:DUF5813 family protein [Halobaculum gomorrense]SHG76643.1 hypothetical protein SAMN05443636_1013 [Halobaculum gomorrense]